MRLLDDMVRIIDGTSIADELQKKLHSLSQTFYHETGITPGLAVLRVGKDQASEIYIHRKRQISEELGYIFEEYQFPETITTAVLEQEINKLNQKLTIHGIIIQFPLPQQLNKFNLLSAIEPSKDVDGLHPLNIGKLLEGQLTDYIPCTPLGCLTLIQTIHHDLKGMNVGVIGCSLLVGRPMAMLMLNHGSTVWMADINTNNLPELCSQADILIVAAGSAGLVKGEWIKPGATVIDVGINRLPTGKITGDVDFPSALKRAGAITPVPGGVGPMTVACLMQNTLKAAFRSVGKELKLE